MSKGHVNSIVHEVQKAHSIELGYETKRHIERIVMDAIKRETKVLKEEKHYWESKYFSILDK